MPRVLRSSLMAVLFALIMLPGLAADAKEITIRGRLSKTVEAGGWLISTEKEKYLLLNARRFQKESWFTETAEVEALGETRPGTITIYQEGIPFEARSMRPLGSAGTVSEVSAAGLTRVLVTGDSVVRAQPDTALLVISVITQNRNALDAQRENANRTDAVIRALRAVAGANVEIKTSGYRIQPQRVYKENQPPTISGYEVSNSVTVETGDLTKVGALIDAAAQAGANNVDSVSFMLRKDLQAREQALADAAREAMSKARALAQALGGSFIRVLEVEEEGARPRPVYTAEYGAQRTMAADSRPTPIEVGTLEVESRVRLVAEIEIRR